MITAIVAIILAIVIIKTLGPILLDAISLLFTFLSVPFGLIAGFISFLNEAALFVGLLWLVVTIFGL